jgi:hypothetical protein
MLVQCNLIDLNADIIFRWNHQRSSPNYIKNNSVPLRRVFYNVLVTRIIVRICIVFPTCGVYIALQMAGLEATACCPGYVTRVTVSPPHCVGTHPLLPTWGLPAGRGGQFWELGKTCSTYWEMCENDIYKRLWLEMDRNWHKLINHLMQRPRGQGPGSERWAVGDPWRGGGAGVGQDEGRCHPHCTAQVSRHPPAASTPRRLQRFQRGAVPWPVPPVRGGGPDVRIPSRPLLSCVPWSATL